MMVRMDRALCRKAKLSGVFYEPFRQILPTVGFMASSQRQAVSGPAKQACFSLLLSRPKITYDP
jgi:hypothetical protein